MELCLAVSISANSLQTQIMQVIGDVDGSMNKSFDCQKGGGGIEGRFWRYQRNNQIPYIEKGHNGQKKKDRQWSTKHYTEN